MITRHDGRLAGTRRISSADAPAPRQRIAIGLAGLALGGAQINAIDLARTLRDRGHSVHVFAFGDPPAVSVLPLAEASRFEVEILRAHGSVLRQARGIHAMVRRQQASILHVFGDWQGPAALLSRGLGSRPGLVVTNWNMYNPGWIPPDVTYVVGTEALLDEARGRWGNPSVLLEPPVNLAVDHPDAGLARGFRAQLGIPTATTLITVVSRLDRAMKSEGIANSIRAVQRLGDDSAVLLVVGDGDGEEALRAIAAEVNGDLARRAVMFTGAMHDPRPAYAAADIVLGMGGSALRGLAFQKPVVVLGESGFSRVFDRSSSEYFLQEGFYGVGCDDEPIDQLVRSLRLLIPAPTRVALGDFGLEVVEARFSLSRAVDRLELIYQESLDRARPPARVAPDAAYTLSRVAANRTAAMFRRALAPARPK